MLNARDNRFYYPKHDGTADGQALTAHVVDAGSTASTIVCNELTGADDAYNDWTVLGLTGTNLAGVAAHAKDFVASTDTLTLARALAGAPGTADTFRLISTGAGEFRSSLEIPGLAATSPTGLTGATINYASPLCGTGTLYIDWDRDGTTMALKAPGDTQYGAAVTVAANGTYSLFSNDEDKCVDVVATYASLPVADAVGTSTLSQYEGRLFPHVEGYQSSPGLIRYRSVFVKNENGTDTAHEVKAYLEPRVTAATTLSTAAGSGTASFTVASGTAMPARSFWLKNTDTTDYRYIKYRSGNTLFPAAVDWAKLSFDAGTDAGTAGIAVGDEISGTASGATATVMSVGVTSGAWASGDAAGVLYLKDISGTFVNNESLEVSSVVLATAAADSSLGYRDGTYTATWGTAVNVAVAPDLDIARAALDGGTTLPTDLAALDYSAPTTGDTGIDLGGGELAPAAKDGIALRQWIVDECYPVDDVVMQMRVRAW